MADSSLTTIVVVNQNYGRFLGDAVRSVLAQTTRPKILVVDDASSDDTHDVLNRLQAEHPLIASHCFPISVGLACVRNYAAERASTEWILYLDADDWLDTEYVAKAESWLQTHGDVDVLTTDMAIVRDGRTRRVIRSKVPHFWDDLLSRNTITQPSFIRRRLIRRLGGYDPGLLFEDWDFWIRLLQSGGRIGRLPGTHVFWRDHGLNNSKRCDERAAADAVRRKHQRLIATA